MNIKKLIPLIVSFVTVDIWRMRKSELTGSRWKWVSVAKVVLLAGQKFSADSCKDKASALTYYSLLSIVPLAAMAFGVANAFGFDSVLTQFIYDSFQGHETVAEYLISFSETYLNSIKGGVVAGVGFAMLIWTVMTLVGHMESIFNQIWGTDKGRSLVRKFTDYISIVLVAIIAVVAYSSVVVSISSYFASDDAVMQKIWVVLMSIAPFFLIWFGLAAIYFLLPNVKVKFSSAFLGGVVAGTALMITQFIYVYFQVGISKNNAVYGSFAAIPLFMIWMQTTWHIIMLGCEVAYAAQNFTQHDKTTDASTFSISLKRKISLYVAAYVTKKFDACEPAPTVNQISNELNIPQRLVLSMVCEMRDCGLLSELNRGDKQESAYQPAFDISKLTVSKFVRDIEMHGENSFDNNDEGYKKVELLVDDFFADDKSELGTKLLKDI